MQPVISVRDIVKEYSMGGQPLRILKGISFDIMPGDFVAILGPSGSGKSTLMNILGCLDSPTAGTYELDGVDVSSLHRDQLAEIRNRKLGFVFQQFNLLARTSAVENVELPLMYCEVSPRERHERALEALSAVALGQRADHHPSQLSGGQQQRVAIARALVNRPSLILADEPTGALDTRTSLEIMAIFQRLNAQQGITMVVVTHDLDVAHYATRQLEFRDGRLQREERIAHPADAAADLAALPLDPKEGVAA